MSIGKSERIFKKAFHTRSHKDLGDLIDHFGRPAATPGEIAYLATGLAQSGDVLSIPAGRNTADIASTGGPTSLVTLIAPLALRELGFWVPKLGVPGRPAGGIDVLSQIPSYRVALKRAQVSKILLQNGYAHFLAGEHFAPYDALLFEFRKRTGSIANARLATASLLAKKIAAGVHRMGLDVRVGPHGNFGETFSKAERNAQFFCDTAQKLGITATCFLSDGISPYQPFLGRGESLLALADVLAGRSSNQLAWHADRCMQMAAKVAGVSGPFHPTPAVLKKHFENNLRSQGSSFRKFSAHTEKLRERPRHSIIAAHGGRLRVDLGVLREIIVQLQNAGPKRGFNDPCGLVFTATAGDMVQRGDRLATVRAHANAWKKFRRRFVRGFQVDSNVNGGKRMEISNA